MTLLEREIYEVGEAARLLGVHVRTLRNWLDGYTARGKTYRPVLRDAATGSDLLTWGEFVEAGYLNEYRRIQRIPLPEIRRYIETWRDKLGVAHPLAHQRPYAGPGPGLMDTAEVEDGPSIMFRFRDGQLILTPWAEEFVRKVEFDNSVAHRYWPAGKDQPVVIDPERSFGAPIVGGVRTEVLYEMFAAGDPLYEIADGYELDRHVVEAAIRYESTHPKARVSASAA